MTDMPPIDHMPSGRALLKERDYLLFWTSRFSGSFAAQIQSVAMGWQMYALARESRTVAEAAFLVGMIGLAGFLPMLLLSLPAGEAADRYDRRKVLFCCLAGEALSVLVLTVATLRGVASVPLLLGVAAVFGASRAFFSPANTSLGPMMVPRALLPRAIAWNSLAWQSASIGGPAIAGFLLTASVGHAYVVSLCLYGVTVATLAGIRKNTRPEIQPGSRLALIKEGMVYVWRQKTVFGAISLDLFAVLLAGSYALLPVFARDVLHVGASGFGVLRAAPAVGATLAALYLGVNPIRRRAGLYMFSGVAVFGLGTIVFGLSRVLWLSVTSLIVLGFADMLSVFVRQTLIQLVTPDHMRGRVAAISTVFIGGSNELGEFESGVVARLLGPVGAAVFGGVGALIVTGTWAWLFPALRKADRLE